MRMFAHLTCKAFAGRVRWLAALAAFAAPAWAHDGAVSDLADPAANVPLSANYILTFTLSSDDKKQQQGDLITARRAVSFDFVDDPEHTLRFKGQLKETDARHVTLAYSAMLVTTVATTTDARQTATTSGEGAVILEFEKPVTILNSPRQRLAVSIRPAAPAASSATSEGRKTSVPPP